MFKSPIEYLNELIYSIMSEISNAAFSWLKIYLFAPTNLKSYPYVSEAYDIVFAISVTVGGVFFTYQLFHIILNRLAGFQQSSIQEMLARLVVGGTLAMLAPFLLQNIMLPINNAIVQIFLDKGLEVETFATFVVVPGATTAVLMASFVMAILFLLLAIQYMIRTAELLILFIMSPIAAWSIVNDDLNIWGIWWREMLSTVFTQSFQVMIIWLAFNMIGDGQELKDFIIGFGFLVFCLMSPGFLRGFLYTTGAGRTAANLAGGAGKAVLFRYVTQKLVD